MNPLVNSNRSLLAAVFVVAEGVLAVCAPIIAAQTLGSDRKQISGPLTLKEAIQIGMRENLMVHAAGADADAAAAEVRMARSMTYPQVSANSYLTAGDAANIFSSSPGVTPTNSNLVPSRGFADLNLTLMYPVYTGGRLSSMVRAATERRKATLADVNTVQAETALMIKDAYYRALLGSDFVKVAQARIDSDTEMLRTVQAQLDAGKGIEAAVQRAQAELSDAQRELTTVRNEQSKAMLDLKTVMGVRLDSEITLADSTGFAPYIGGLNTSLLEAAKTRPELASKRAGVGAAQAQTSAAQGSLQPQVYAGAMTDAFTSASMSGRTGYTAGLTVSLPLFDGGQRRAEVAQARSMQRRAEAEQKDTELRVSNEVRKAWLDLETAEQNYRTAQSALTAANSAYEVIALRVQNQKSILVEQLDALVALTRARANLAQSQYDHSMAVARLQRAIGRP